MSIYRSLTDNKTQSTKGEAMKTPFPGRRFSFPRLLVVIACAALIAAGTWLAHIYANRIGKAAGTLVRRLRGCDRDAIVRI